MLAADSVSVISQAEAAVAGGQGAGTGKMDEEYKNKMARTPGTGSRLSKVPGSGTRAPSSSPSPPPLAGQWSDRCAFWVQRADTMGKTRQVGRNRGGREGWQGGRGSEETKRTRDIDRRMTLLRPTCPRTAIMCSWVWAQSGRLWGLGPGCRIPPSFPLGSPNLTQAHILEGPSAPP